MENSIEICAICGCKLHRRGDYSKPTIQGRAHATKHHFVPERFFGRSANRPGENRDPIFNSCPWNMEGNTAVFCYECHEELLHNPVFLPEDIKMLSKLVHVRKLHEKEKGKSRKKIAGRIKLLHEIIQSGLENRAEETDE